METQYNWSEKMEKFSMEVSKPKVGILIASYGSATMQSNQTLRNFQVKLEEYGEMFLQVLTNYYSNTETK